MSRIGLSAAVVVVLAMALWGMSRQRDADASVRSLSSAVARAEQTAAGASSSVERLRRSVIAAQKQSSRGPVPGTREAPAELDDETGPEPNTEPSRLEERAPTHSAAEVRGVATHERVVQEISGRFDAEPVDSRWADEARNNVEAAVEPFLSTSVDIRSVSCKTSMCRLEVVHDDVEGYRSFMQQVLHSEICRDCFAAKTGEAQDGSLTMTVFLAREGHALPRVARVATAP
ncbi:hypothetical protein [Sorangium sp. So ce131]|uniref:hypothetical protein n=1 Tax=Sorangium sp. So ce131 TaxID=3133282 RepID=UPI003F62FC4B